jgi:hypothetical protein
MGELSVTVTLAISAGEGWKQKVPTVAKRRQTLPKAIYYIGFGGEKGIGAFCDCRLELYCTGKSPKIFKHSFFGSADAGQVMIPSRRVEARPQRQSAAMCMRFPAV